MALRNINSKLILGTRPKQYASEVPVKTQIKVTFQRDMDINTINTSTFQLATNSGEIIEGQITYKKKEAIFIPDNPLNPDTTYQATIIGESNPDDPKGEGIKDILGNMLFGNYTWTFTTEDSKTIEKPTLKEPYNEVFLKNNPVEFSWERPEGAIRFEIQIAKDRNFRAIIWPKKESSILDTYVSPNIELPDGQYWWRVRAIDSRRRPSQWSKVWTFSIDTLEEGKVSEQDAETPEIIETGYIPPRELAELFPEKHGSNIDLNLGAIVIKVLGDVDPDEVSHNNLTITGHSITDGTDPQDHGKVNGTISVFKKDGLSYIIFQLEPIEQ